MVQCSAFYLEIADFTKSRAEKNTRKMPLLSNKGAERSFMRTGLTKQEKTTDISFDESGKTVSIRTHNTDLKNRLTAFSERYPDLCRMTEDDVEIGCKSFEIDKRRFSIRLTAPYTEERRKKASEYAKLNGFQNKKPEH